MLDYGGEKLIRWPCLPCFGVFILLGLFTAFERLNFTSVFTQYGFGTRLGNSLHNSFFDGGSSYYSSKGFVPARIFIPLLVSTKLVLSELSSTLDKDQYKRVSPTIYERWRIQASLFKNGWNLFEAFLDDLALYVHHALRHGVVKHRAIKSSIQMPCNNISNKDGIQCFFDSAKCKPLAMTSFLER